MTAGQNAPDTVSTIIPTLRYRDAPAAIDWLCNTFGFEAELVVPGEEGSIAHAQLAHFRKRHDHAGFGRRRRI